MITYHDYSNNKRIVTTSPRVLAIHIYHHHGKQKLTFGPISNGRLSYPSRLCPGGSLQWSKCHGCTSHPPTAGLPGSDIDLPAKWRAPLFRRLVHQKWEQKDRDERRKCVYLYEIQLHTWLLARLYLIHIYIPGQVICIDVYELALELCVIRVPTPMYHSTLMCQNVPKLATGGKFSLTLPTTNYTKD